MPTRTQNYKGIFFIGHRTRGLAELVEKNVPQPIVDYQLSRLTFRTPLASRREIHAQLIAISKAVADRDAETLTKTADELIELALA